MSFSILFSLLITFIIVFYNFSIINTINFTLISLLLISLTNFLSCFISFFSYESIENRDLKTKIKDCIFKNRKLLKNNNEMRHDLILQNLKNAHLTLVISSLTKNNEIFIRTTKELESLGLTSEVFKKYKDLITLINLIEAKKVEIIISNKDQKLIFKDISKKE